MSRKIRVRVYEFDELSKEAKDKAVAAYSKAATRAAGFSPLPSKIIEIFKRLHYDFDEIGQRIVGLSSTK